MAAVEILDPPLLGDHQLPEAGNKIENLLEQLGDAIRFAGFAFDIDQRRLLRNGERQRRRRAAATDRTAAAGSS